MVERVGRIDPGQPGAHLRRGYIGAAAAHIGHCTAVVVGVHRLQCGLLFEAQLRQVLP